MTRPFGLDEADVIIAALSVRAVGHTRAMLVGAVNVANCRVVFATHADAVNLSRGLFRPEQLVPLVDAQKLLYGTSGPVVLDHSAILVLLGAQQEETARLKRELATEKWERDQFAVVVRKQLADAKTQGRSVYLKLLAARRVIRSHDEDNATSKKFEKMSNRRPKPRRKKP